MCPVGCAGCVRTVDFVEPLRARLRVGAWIVFASVLVSRPHCWCGWCLDDLISCRRVFQCRWHGPVAPFLRGWWVCCHGRMVDALAGSTDEGRVGPR